MSSETVQLEFPDTTMLLVDTQVSEVEEFLVAVPVLEPAPEPVPIGDVTMHHAEECTTPKRPLKRRAEILVRVMNPKTMKYCDNVPKSVADLIHAVYETRSIFGYDDDKSLKTCAEIYDWNVDLFIKFIWDGYSSSHEQILEWLKAVWLDRAKSR
jgi:hypothetical protein